MLDGIQKAPDAETWDILFEISSSTGDVGEAIRWEVIRDTADNYLTLHGKRRLFRVAAEPSCPDVGVRILPNPIRFAAFLFRPRSTRQTSSTAS